VQGLEYTHGAMHYTIPHREWLIPDIGSSPALQSGVQY